VICHMAYDKKERIRFWYPQCIGGAETGELYGCTCDREKYREEKDDLEKRFEALENRISVLEGKRK